MNAQFTTPTISGTIDALGTEYGNHEFGFNAGVSADRRWFMTWDDANLYVGVKGADLTHRALVYLDVDPILPVDGGTLANGSLTGPVYDGVGFARLPFRADFLVMFRDGVGGRVYRRHTEMDGWQTEVIASWPYDNKTWDENTREVAIPWNDITGNNGRPSSFNWFGYLAAPDGEVYGSMPPMREIGYLGTSIRDPWYLSVTDTSDNAQQYPFASHCFTYVNFGDAFLEYVTPGFGSFADVTLNRPGITISRMQFEPTREIRSLTVGGGVFHLGDSALSLTTFGDVNILGGRLTLGGDLLVHGDLRRHPAGEFRANGAQVEFRGSRDSVIEGSFTGDNRFQSLRLNKSGAWLINMEDDVEINGRLWLSSGILQTNGHLLSLLSSTSDSLTAGVRRVAGTDSGFVRGTVRRRIQNPTGIRQFPVGTTGATPLFMDFEFPGPTGTGVVDVSTTEGFIASFDASNMVARTWEVDVVQPLGEYKATIGFRYLSTDVDPGLIQANLRAAKRFAPTSFYPHDSTWLSPNFAVETLNASAQSVMDEVSLGGTWILSTATDSVLRVELTSLTAFSNGIGHPVLVEWATAAEYMNAGFNVYAVDEDGGLRRLNDFPLPAIGSEVEGAEYTFEDARPMQLYEVRRYVLEDVEFSGKKTHHGPVSVGPFESQASEIDAWSLYGQ